jgi:hypothetical protein
MVRTVTLVLEVLIKLPDYGVYCDFGIRGDDETG